MGTFSRFRPAFHRAATEDVATPQSAPMEVLPTTDEKIAGTATTMGNATDVISPDTNTGEPQVEEPVKDILPSEDAQRGVQQVEAVTLTWSKPSLIAVFIW